MTRKEHLAWCKERSKREETVCLTIASFASDMGKHHETCGHPMLGMLMTRSDSKESLDEFIDGFN